MKKWFISIVDYIVPISGGGLITCILFGRQVKIINSLDIIDNKQIVPLIIELAELILWTSYVVYTYFKENFKKINEKLDYIAEHKLSPMDYKSYKEKTE